jgi:hypothetical protein
MRSFSFTIHVHGQSFDCRQSGRKPTPCCHHRLQHRAQAACHLFSSPITLQLKFRPSSPQRHMLSLQCSHRGLQTQSCLSSGQTRSQRGPGSKCPLQSLVPPPIVVPRCSLPPEKRTFTRRSAPHGGLVPPNHKFLATGLLPACHPRRDQTDASQEQSQALRSQPSPNVAGKETHRPAHPCYHVHL